MDHITRGLSTFCPFCKYEVDTATGISGKGSGPGPGDISLCLKCGEFAAYGDDMQLRKPTDDEYLIIGSEDDYKLAREAWTSMNQRRQEDPDSAYYQFSVLDKEFDRIGDQIAALNAPPGAHMMLKIMFALGATSVFNMIHISKDKLSPHQTTILMQKYAKDLQKFYEDMHHEITNKPPTV
jgi:hypothetical protein